MDILTAIHTRHSFGKVKPDPVPHELIEQLLSAAVQAPNHHKVRPWRFVVLTGQGRERLGEKMAESFKARFPEAPASAYEKESQKPLRAPLIIVVAANQPEDPRIKAIENICASAAACQNILLAANGLGLAGMWRTGDAASDPEIIAFLGFSPEQTVLGFLYIGYPDFIPAEFPERPSFEDRMVWME
jgi:nitroreductase